MVVHNCVQDVCAITVDTALGPVDDLVEIGFSELVLVRLPCLEGFGDTAGYWMSLPEVNAIVPSVDLPATVACVYVLDAHVSILSLELGAVRQTWRGASDWSLKPRLTGPFRIGAVTHGLVRSLLRYR